MNSESDDRSTNPTSSPAIGDLFAISATRRNVMRSGLGLAALGFITGNWLSGCSDDDDTADGGGSDTPAERMLGFSAIAISSADAISLPSGYTHQVLIPWGEPINAVAPAWLSDASQGWQEQEQQIGDNHDGMTFFGFNSSGTGPGTRSDEGLLVLNHEYINPEYFYKPGTDPADWLVPFTFDKAKKGQAAHGISVVHMRRDSDATWSHVTTSPYNRRITGYTQMQLQGPAAGHTMMQTAADPTGHSVLGTLNNCANGFTPWGTYLTCEENFNGYFGAKTAFTADAHQTRYGFSSGGFGYRWHTVDPRFDLNDTPNEANRHGWVVEIDPFNPGSTPVKRTALGRFKHENAEVVIAPSGKVVVYMGDDQANDYVYKFVSDGTFNAADPYSVANRSLLAAGTLYVATFGNGATSADFAGTGTWIALVHDTNGLNAGAGFADQGEVLIKARLAADLVGATKMDRPEWISANPKAMGEVFMAMTNNSGRATTDDANPRTSNRYGQILKVVEDGYDPTATTFAWDMFVLAGNPNAHTAPDLRAGSSNITSGNTFNSPDGIGFDAFGRLWIQTDGNYSNTGDYLNQGNNQMLAADPVSKEIRRFFVGPAGCEVTGLTFTPDRKTMFINIQHPGEVGNHPNKPAAYTDDNWIANNADQFSTWPGGAGSGRPRSATVVIRRLDGRPVGDGDAPAAAAAAIVPAGFMGGAGAPLGLG